MPATLIKKEKKEPHQKKDKKEGLKGKKPHDRKEKKEAKKPRIIRTYFENIIKEEDSKVIRCPKCKNEDLSKIALISENFVIKRLFGRLDDKIVIDEESEEFLDEKFKKFHCLKCKKNFKILDLLEIYFCDYSHYQFIKERAFKITDA